MPSFPGEDGPASACSPRDFLGLKRKENPYFSLLCPPAPASPAPGGPR